ncbi:MAG: tol-pal system-associated acyl-CoA thioesterase [bacterium]
MFIRSTLPIRIYYEDTDFSGIVYHANYLKFFERGRTEFLRELGLAHSDLLAGEDAMVFAVRHMELDFLRPARIDDLLEVQTSLMEMRGARMIFNQVIMKEDQKLVSGRVEVAALTPEGRPRRIPEIIKTKLSAMIEAK